MYLLNEKLEQRKVPTPPIIPQHPIIKDSINYLPPIFFKLNEEKKISYSSFHTSISIWSFPFNIFVLIIESILP